MCFFIGFPFPNLIVIQNNFTNYKFVHFMPYYIFHFIIYFSIGYCIDLLIKKYKLKKENN